MNKLLLALCGGVVAAAAVIAAGVFDSPGRKSLAPAGVINGPGICAPAGTPELIAAEASQEPGRIVFDRNSDIWSVDPDGKNEKNLTNTPDFKEWWARLSPDGTRIAFAGAVPGAKCDIWLMNSDGSGRVRVTDTATISEEAHGWSPDGKRIVFSRQEGSTITICTLAAEQDSTDLQQLTSGPGDTYPDWSPCGKYVVFGRAMTWGQSTGHWQLHCVKIDSREVTRLTTSDLDDTVPAWSRDGTSVAFASTSNGNSGRDQIYLAPFSVSTAGTPQLGAWERITDGVSRFVQPRWSPTGKKMLFMKAGSSSTMWDIWTMAADGSNPASLVVTPGVREGYPDWGTTPAPPNRAPVAQNHSEVLVEDTQVAIALKASDPDNDPLTFVIDTPPAHGALTGFNAQTGTATYVPDRNYFGPDTFTFLANDGELDSNLATVTLQITPVNDPPEVECFLPPTPAYVKLQTTETFQVWMVDPDNTNDELTYSWKVDDATAVSVTDSLTYSPGPQDVGQHSITVTVTDPSGDRATHTWDVIVVCRLVEAPVFTPEPGAYPGPVTVKITCPTPGARIRYTTDGTEPTTKSALYLRKKPVVLKTTTTLKARAFVGSKSSGPVATGIYTIGS
jgi:Chitobiase/beta-hexosaminidase C-terminal domain/Bacterial Ig domain/WD40-like Beta Propeller Repeat